MWHVRFKRIQIFIKLVTAKSRNMYLKAKKSLKIFKKNISEQTLQILSEKIFLLISKL